MCKLKRDNHNANYDEDDIGEDEDDDENEDDGKRALPVQEADPWRGRRNPKLGPSHFYDVGDVIVLFLIVKQSKIAMMIR